MTSPTKHAAAVDVEKLRRLAEAATPGPWIWNEVYECIHSHVNADSLFPVCRMSNNRPVVENMHFIEAANPSAIHSLLDRLAAAEGERDSLLNANEAAMESQERYVEMKQAKEAAEARIKEYDDALEHSRKLTHTHCDLIDELTAALAASEKRAGEYRKALEPFAGYAKAEGIESGDNMTTMPMLTTDSRILYVRDFANARQALADPQHGGGELKIDEAMLKKSLDEAQERSEQMKRDSRVDPVQMLYPFGDIRSV